MRPIKRTYLLVSLLILSIEAYVLLASEDAISLGLASIVADKAIEVIHEWGYAGVFILMCLESALIPIPSEVVVPLAGYLSYSGTFDFWTIVIITTMANLAGSLIAYLLGRSYGRRFLERYGKLLSLKKSDLELAERWFSKYGSLAILVGRMTPAVRTVISLPAGIGKMDPLSFSTLTFLGSIPWNFALTYAGVVMGENWFLIEELLGRIDLLILTSVFLLLIYLLIERREELG